MTLIARISYIVSSDHVNAVNNSIDAKIKRDALEQQNVSLDVKEYVVKQLIKKKN